MTKQDRQKASILVVLLGVLGLTLLLGYRMYRPQTASSVQPAETKIAANTIPSANGVRILLEKVEKSEGEEEDIGKRNIFQYRQAPEPKPPVSGRGRPTPIVTPPVVPVNPEPPPVIVTGPPKPPPPPPINLKYQGFASRNTPQPGFIAFLSDDSRHYNVTVGEVLMGRYRIKGITEKLVEVEDLEYNRNQSLPLVK
jgi:hypothetical protein